MLIHFSCEDAREQWHDARIQDPEDRETLCREIAKQIVANSSVFYFGGPFARDATLDIDVNSEPLDVEFYGLIFQDCRGDSRA